MKYEEPFRSEDVEDSRYRFNLWEGYFLPTRNVVTSPCSMFVEETYLLIITKLLSLILASFRIQETLHLTCCGRVRTWKSFCQFMKISTFELYNANPIYFFTKYSPSQW